MDKEAMTITAEGGCKAVDLETPLQGRLYDLSATTESSLA